MILGMDLFHLFEKRRRKNEKQKIIFLYRNDRFSLKKTIIFRFYKNRGFFKTVVFKNDPCQTTDNDDTSLAIVNDFSKRKYIFLIGKSEVSKHLSKKWNYLS